MIRIGLTTWSEHEDLTSDKHKPSLSEYAAVLPAVELDTPYYGIPRKSTAENWLLNIPEDFRFLIKANQSMTCQVEDFAPYGNEAELFAAYKKAIEPLVSAKKLAGILFQFPGHFTCNRENVEYLRKIRQLMGNWPIVIELRNASWYESKMIDKTFQFMWEMSFSLATIDEPQVVGRSVPFIPTVTNSELAVFRFHGRNQTGWQAQGPDWRKKRTLYCYNQEELTELAEAVTKAAREAKEVLVIFNNNSGGDAAKNALQLKEILKLEYHNLNPQQLDLFE